MIYLDNAATTKLDPRVLDAMLPYLSEYYGNPGSVHTLGRRAKQAIDAAREETAKLFGCNSDKVIFTSGGSEGNNMVFSGLQNYLRDTGKTHVIVSAVEHDSVIRSAETLTKLGFHVTYVKPSADGEVPPEAVKNAITEATGLVSVMFANNETGAVNEVGQIGELCHSNGALFHCDCVQAAGQYELNVEQNHIDFATISAHKIHGPKGVGALYARDAALLDPLIRGGAHQEFGLRGGTENVPGIIGLGVACKFAVSGMSQHLVKMTGLKQTFVRGLLDALSVHNLGDAGIHINCHSHLNPGKVLNMTIDDVFGDTLVMFMDGLGICISSGSACTEHEAEPSHVLTAIGLDDVCARQSVRLSFSRFNTEEEVIDAANAMASSIQMLRTIRDDVYDEGGDSDG